eukprot:9552231-Alexandrium_andersonii.AAC.1
MVGRHPCADPSSFAATELNGLVHDRKGLPVEREARQYILDRHKFLTEQAIAKLKHRSASHGGPIPAEPLPAWP